MFELDFRKQITGLATLLQNNRNQGRGATVREPERASHSVTDVGAERE